MVETLKEEIRLLRNGKNSGRNHTPASHQIGRPNAKSFRAHTDRKSGGQKGHQGSTLKIKEVPDETINYIPQYCSGCIEDLQQIAPVFKESKQEVIIPPVEIPYVEPRSYSKVCGHYGKTCTAALPGHLTSPLQYGVLSGQ